MGELDSELERAALALFESVIDLPSDQRAAAIEASDASEAVRQRARQLAETVGSEGSAFQTGGAGVYASDMVAIPERVGAYRLIEEIGRGGMGMVFRARRDAGDFEHEVAIKMVLTGTLSSRLVERFRYERQTLASLSHPHIARLFDGGETADGQPYLVMELVEGRSLRRWVMEEKPSLKRRLAAFMQVLDALRYAHSRLVIHRDLTPDNVIIGAEENAKVIDFGISSFQSLKQGGAGAVKAREVENLSTGHTGTPGFSAPEYGPGTEASVAMDIFALGKLLAYLLDGADTPELDAIAAKAGNDDPEARYASVAEMAADLERYEAGEPVRAFAGSRSYILRKFVGRNRALVAAAAAVAGVILISVTGLALAYDSEREARRLAQERFAAIRDLANFQLFDVYDQLLGIDGTIEVREAIADKTVDYLDALGKAPTAPLDVQREAGVGWLRMSEITGGASGDHIGDPERSKDYAVRSLELLRRVFEADPADPENRYAYGRALTKLTVQSLYMHGDADQGFERARKAVEVLKPLPPGNLRNASILISAHRVLGDAYGWKNEIPTAGTAYADAIAVYESLPEAAREDPEVANPVAAAYRQMAEVYRHTGRLDEAVAQMEASLAHAVAVRDRSSGGDRRRADRSLAIERWNMADMYLEAGQLDKGAAVARGALDEVSKAIAANPGDIGWVEVKPQLLRTLAQIEHRRGRGGAALAAADEAIAISRDMRRLSGRNIGADLAVAVAWKDVARVYVENGRKADGCAGLREADAILTRYSKTGELSEFDTENNAKPVRAMLSLCA